MSECQSARMSKNKNGGLDQYGTECFEQQQSGTTGVERVECSSMYHIVTITVSINLIPTAEYRHGHGDDHRSIEIFYLDSSLANCTTAESVATFCWQK